MTVFHRRCGDRVTLTNGGKTAFRNFSEFNYGLVFSSEPLVDDELFEVRIDKKINSWSGSIEIGVTACDPDTIELPSCATELRDGSWIMSGNSIMRDGRPVVEVYGVDLEKLVEGDRVGIMRTAENELIFFVNGENQGVAADHLPSRVFAVIDMYGKCAQVSIIEPGINNNNNNNNNNNAVMQLCENGIEIIDCTRTTTNQVTNLNVDINVNSINRHNDPERLQFHERCGVLVKLSSNNRTAERRRPLDEFNNGVVMTNRPLRDNELFEIRIDRLVDKWSGSIEVGVTTHNPNLLELPATMTNLRSGTTMMSGCGILTNGKGTKREYGEFNLDELREGDRIGMMRKSNSNLHYYINGMDQGVAATKVPAVVWGVVDLYGMTVKVTIVDRDEREEQNLITRRNTALSDQNMLHGLNDMPEEDAVDRLMFHPSCGTHAAVINNGRTAHRPNAMDDFNNGVVLTNRPLKRKELFEVRLDKMVTKWAGSIEIGVTTHHPTELEYPSTMTNIRSGTWMMTGNGIMHNGSTVFDDYGQNLDRLQVGDRVGVMCREDGSLHFFVNGVDQGIAASNIPASVYGVIDLYGQAAQATILDTMDCCYSPETANSSLSNTTVYSDLRFHHFHGKNARVSHNGLTASRPRAFGEFNDAIVISNRALREGEMFEVVLEKMVDRWSGSIEAGVTAIRPEDLNFPSTMTDITHDTWMLSGSSVMQDGVTLRNGYDCDLDSLAVGTKIGMMRHDDGTLHYYIDGVDKGAACENVPAHVYVVIDLYGQCAQVSIVQCDRRDTATYVGGMLSENSSQPLSLPLVANQPTLETAHKFSLCCGKNIILGSGNTVATRVRNYSHALVFSSTMLEQDEMFEVSIQDVALQWSGTLHVGVTTFQISDSYPSSNLPPGISGLSADTWFVSGSEVRRNGYVLKSNYCPSLEWLVVGNKVGVRRCVDGSLRFTINGEDMGIAATGLPKRVFAVVELYGSVTSISVISTRASQGHSEALMIESLRSSKLHDSLEMLLDTTLDHSPDDAPSAAGGYKLDNCDTADGNTAHLLTFHENHGRNIQLGHNRTSARRIASYNQGVVISSRPLPRDLLFQVRIGAFNSRWMSSLMCGVVSLSLERLHFPLTALAFKKHSWIISGDCVFQNGIKIKGCYGLNLDNLQTSLMVGVLVDTESRLHLYINGVDQGVAATDIPQHCFAVFDVYGQCEEVTIVQCGEANMVEISGLPLASEETESLSEKADLECDEKEKLTPPPSLSLCNKTIQSSSSSIAISNINSNSNNSLSNAISLTNIELISNAIASVPTSRSTPISTPLPGTPIVTTPTAVFKNCDYQSMCIRFKNTLGVPEGFFLRDHSVCYCDMCHKIRGSHIFHYKGEPPSEYAVPCGWCRFTLRRQPGADSALDKWHVAFYGTSLSNIRTILDRGQLLLPGEMGIERTTIKDKSKEDDSDGSQLLFSPSLRYASSVACAEKCQFIDPKTKKVFQAFAAFQILVQPGSYKVGPPSKPVDHDTVEWVTKERGATVLCALLVKLDALL